MVQRQPAERSLMKLCPLCQAEYPDDQRHCVADGERLVSLSSSGETLVGTVFNGKYRLDEKIGEGGMGSVYRGTQQPVGRAVAVKVLHRQLASDKTSVRRFFNEAQVVSRLRHPNTVTLYDFGQSDSGHLFIAMEYLGGKSLLDVFQEESLTLPEILEIVDQVCQALEEAHNQGIIHRDLKPENIFVERVGAEPLIKVLDFGIAKITDSTEHLTRTGMVFGTPTYMSPEQAQGYELDHRTDIYTVGVLLYEALAGQPPFIAETPMQVALKQVTTLPQPISDMSRLRPLPKRLSALVMELLEKDPTDRPQSIAEVRKRLVKIARGLPGLTVHRSGIKEEVLRVLPPASTMLAPWRDHADTEVSGPVVLSTQQDEPVSRTTPPPIPEDAAIPKTKISALEIDTSDFDQDIPEAIGRSAIEAAVFGQLGDLDVPFDTFETAAHRPLLRRAALLFSLAGLLAATGLGLLLFRPPANEPASMALVEPSPRDVSAAGPSAATGDPITTPTEGSGEPILAVVSPNGTIPPIERRPFDDCLDQALVAISSADLLARARAKQAGLELAWAAVPSSTDTTAVEVEPSPETSTEEHPPERPRRDRRRSDRRRDRSAADEPEATGDDESEVDVPEPPPELEPDSTGESEPASQEESPAEPEEGEDEPDEEPSTDTLPSGLMAPVTIP